jgi:site-specific DNA-methyltransferase (adenine-specific)
MKKYDVIYADPAWRYDFSKSKSRDIENQYPTMSIKEICDLPVDNMTNKNAVLYLWATAPKLLEALKFAESEMMPFWGTAEARKKIKNLITKYEKENE